MNCRALLSLYLCIVCCAGLGCHDGASAASSSAQTSGTHALIGTNVAPGASRKEILVHPRSKKTWTGTPSGVLTWPAARTYCATVRTGQFSNWRLPTKGELESLVDEAAQHPTDSDPEAHLLHEPFRSALPASGYLFSGELVKSDDDPYVMNLRNGHIFNGRGHKGLVLCVR